MELPQSFVEEMRTALGPDEASRLCAALSQPPAVGVRLNPAKSAPHLFPEAEKVPWCPRGRYLAERPQFTLMPEMHAGAFYVQDPSSMIISEAVRRLTTPDAPVCYLDACAAPGGKITAALAALPRGSMAVANEYVPLRAQILKENIQKWGSPDVIVTQGDTSRLSKLRERFDIVAVDAPCSGEGMMRKDAQAVAQWSPALVDQCAALQRDIISNVWPALKPGGVLIYSTCTFNTRENEQNVRHIIEDYGAEPVNLALPEAWGIPSGLDPDVPALRFMPHRTRGEGLFLCVMRKPGTHEAPDAHKEGYVPIALPGQEAGFLFPQAHLPLLKAVQKQCKVLLAGAEATVPKGRKTAPSPVFPLSTLYDPTSLPAVELSRDEALRYLRREALTLPASAPRGFVAAAHRGLPLGLLNNLGTRANNLYPAAWRIRTL